MMKRVKHELKLAMQFFDTGKQAPDQNEKKKNAVDAVLCHKDTRHEEDTKNKFVPL